jgi:formate hydrogenlyase transcriptional activator
MAFEKATADLYVERELQNLVERAVIRSDNGVLSNPLPTLGANPVSLTPALSSKSDDSQRAFIMVGGPHGAAARLGLKRTILITKMKKLAISRPAWQNDLNGLNGNHETQQWSQPAAE